MKAYIVRPYFGHDCDSAMGFNNGHYLDEIEVEAGSESEAIDKAMDLFLADEACNEGMPAVFVRNGEFGEGTLYWEFDHTDSEGNEVTADQYSELEDDQRSGYQYQYVDFNDVTEA